MLRTPKKKNVLALIIQIAKFLILHTIQKTALKKMDTRIGCAALRVADKTIWGYDSYCSPLLRNPKKKTMQVSPLHVKHHLAYGIPLP